MWIDDVICLLGSGSYLYDQSIFNRSLIFKECTVNNFNLAWIFTYLKKSKLWEQRITEWVTVLIQKAISVKCY